MSQLNTQQNQKEETTLNATLKGQNNIQSKIIFDPQICKKPIKFSGTLGMIIGLAIYYLAFVFRHEIRSIIIFLLIIIGTAYFVLGVLIRRKAEKSEKILYTTLIFTILMVILSIIAGIITGYLLLIYAIIVRLSVSNLKEFKAKKYIKDDVFTPITCGCCVMLIFGILISFLFGWGGMFNWRVRLFAKKDYIINSNEIKTLDEANFKLPANLSHVPLQNLFNFSPDGNKLIYVDEYRNLSFYDFEKRVTGIITPNYFILDDFRGGINDVQWSPNSSKVTFSENSAFYYYNFTNNLSVEWNKFFCPSERSKESCEKGLKSITVRWEGNDKIVFTTDYKTEFIYTLEDKKLINKEMSDFEGNKIELPPLVHGFFYNYPINGRGLISSRVSSDLEAATHKKIYDLLIKNDDFKKMDSQSCAIPQIEHPYKKVVICASDPEAAGDMISYFATNIIYINNDMPILLYRLTRKNGYIFNYGWHNNDFILAIVKGNEFKLKKIVFN